MFFVFVFFFWAEHQEQRSTPLQLSVGPDDSGLQLRLTESHIKALWKKAALLKSTKTAIYPQPSISLMGEPSKSLMVASFVGNSVHTIEIISKGSITCNYAGFSAETQEAI